VEGELHPFNDRRLNEDLAAVCARVNAAQPRLPDGRQLQVHAPWRLAVVSSGLTPGHHLNGEGSPRGSIGVATPIIR
jgi:hypothetical protein